MNTLPYLLLNEAIPSPLLITAEHAGVAWPPDLDSRDLPAGWTEEHFATDRGISALVTWLGSQLRCCCLLGHYSRLLVDLNRLRTDPEVIALETDGLELRCNILTETMRQQRLATYHDPFHAQIRRILHSASPPRYLVSLHSFTRQRRIDTHPRPWDAGVLYTRETPLAELAFSALSQMHGKCIGRNQPYNLMQMAACPIGVLAEQNTIDAIEIEICDDQLLNPLTFELWSTTLLSFFQELIR